jgi:tryptophanyl-tRNA synthetase
MIERKRILSGMRPTNPRLHIGNYEGALRNWVQLQNEGNKMFCMVADWHALTTMSDDPGAIGRNSIEITKDYIAAGIDPDLSSVFIQSHVKEHAELHVLLSMITPLGWLERTPTYKEKRDEMGGQEREPYGLLGYPVLQTCDILLYRPFGVPVGRDQAPHLEIGNDIGARFNRLYNTDIFPAYKYMIPEDEMRAKLPGLDMRKMSKSYDNCIYLSDTAEETAKKLKSAYTTPTKIKKTDPGIPEGCAVCQYLKVYSQNWKQAWDEDIAGERGCMQSKTECTEAINEYLRPIRDRRATLEDGDIVKLLRKGASEAREVASETMRSVRKAMGLAPE